MIPAALFAGIVSLTATLGLTNLIIRLMDSRDLGQYIRSWGPKVHEHKGGTPTMGGLAILGGLGLALLFTWFYYPEGRTYLPLFLLGSFGFGSIGILDDLLSLIKGEAEGLSPTAKIAVQIIVGGSLIYLAFQIIGQPNQIYLPFSRSVLAIPPAAYYATMIVILLGTVNAVNLTDGLDGLAGGTSIITAVSFALIGGLSEVPVFAALVAAIFGFLWYNFYPASIFMGDTGAFALGGFLGTAAIVTNGEFFLPLFGGLFVLETLSVILQVGYYKTTGSRIFKISPLHHHFESAEGVEYDYLLPGCEWAEPRVTARLWTVHLVIAGLGIFGYFAWLT